MSDVTTVGVDLAKRVFAVHGVDAQGKVVLRKTVSRVQLAELIARLPQCLIGMEACSGAHEWARRFQGFGHTVKLMAPQFVAPYRKSGKNDGNDAEAICEAVTRPSMRFVPVKSTEQQVQLCVHRVREGCIQERTAWLNRLRGLLAEFGHVAALGPAQLKRQLPAIIEQLPVGMARIAREVLEQVQQLEARILQYERDIALHARGDELVRRVQTRPGIGPITASAIVASVGAAHEFKNGRQFAAWLGLTPSQHSSGGKQRLGSITRRGDPYLRKLLVMGARSVMLRAPRRADPLSRWALAVRERRGYQRACVAVAAKNARVAWALLRNTPA